MTVEYIELGPTPCAESCAQVGSHNYRELASKEMRAYINQLYRQFGEASEKGVMFKIKWFNHDFGSYGEVCVCWVIEDNAATEYAYFIDSNIPEYWDEEAIKELEGKND